MSIDVPMITKMQMYLPLNQFNSTKLTVFVKLKQPPLILKKKKNKKKSLRYIRHKPVNIFTAINDV